MAWDSVRIICYFGGENTNELQEAEGPFHKLSSLSCLAVLPSEKGVLAPGPCVGGAVMTVELLQVFGECLTCWKML